MDGLFHDAVFAFYWQPSFLFAFNLYVCVFTLKNSAKPLILRLTEDETSFRFGTTGVNDKTIQLKHDRKKTCNKEGNEKLY